MNIDIATKIKIRREKSGLTLAEAAEKIGLSWNEYFDVELHSDEISSVLKLREVKRLCEVLNFDFFDLFDMQCSFCDERMQCIEDYSSPRNELIHKRREELGLSSEALGNRIGFYEAEVQKLEAIPDHIETWTVDDINALSNEIHVPAQILLGIKCNKCR